MVRRRKVQGHLRKRHMHGWDLALIRKVFRVNEDFMQMERRHLRERREGKFRRALGMPDESVEELDRPGEEDRMRAEQGLVGVPIT
jgi:hypothetical protein